MSFRPVRKIAGIGNVFLGTELVDIAEYDLDIYEENPEDHEHHGANWAPGTQKIEGTVVGELPIRKDLRLVTERREFLFARQLRICRDLGRHAG
jgi:hypothetical protein